MQSTNFRSNIRLDSEIIYGFTNSFLLKRFDSPKTTPVFHREIWDYCTSPERFVAIAAPRGHAKSTAVTHSYVLANILFRVKRFPLIIAQTEGQSISFLGDIKREFYENEELIELFGIGDVIKDTEGEVILQFKDKHEAKIIARGSQQAVRGLKWRNTRPDLIVGDDLENDEIVLNEDRRAKFKNWIYNALLPCGSDNCDYRFVGTILHLDSYLNSIMPNDSRGTVLEEPLKIYYDPNSRKRSVWHAILFRAHPALNDFSEILWPDKFSEERLREIRQGYIEQGFPEGYAQEYLNNPIDETSAYFRRQDLIDIDVKQIIHSKDKEPETYYAAIDMAISEKKTRARTAIAVVGLGRSGKIRVRDIWKGRWDGLEIVENIFAVQKRYNPELFIIEEENIAKAIGPFINEEMRKPGAPWVPIEYVKPSADKLLRARSLQARTRTGGIEFDHEADWWPELLEEMSYFPRGKYKDQVDALSWICLKLDELQAPMSYKEQQDYRYQQEYEESYYFEFEGKDPITGY